MALLLLWATLSATPALAKVSRLHAGELVDLSERAAGNCKSGWGTRINVTIATKEEKFVYTYCSEQPLSAYMEQVYPTLRNFLLGPSLGACEIRSYCDAYNRCTYQAGQLQLVRNELVILSNEKNQIDAESYEDIRVDSAAVCVPLLCR